MINFNTEYFENNCYFYLKEGIDKIVLYYSIGDTITESRKKDKKKVFDKKNTEDVKKTISKFLKSKNKKTSSQLEKELNDIKSDGELDELVDYDGTLRSSKIPILNMKQTPRKTMDQTVPMSRVSNDPVTRGYRVYWGESKDNKDNVVNEVDYSDAFGYEETEDKDYKGTVKTLKKMGVENPVERAKQFGKLPNQKIKKTKKGEKVLKQRLSEKEAIEEERKKRLEKMVEDILTKRNKDKSDVVTKETENSMTKFLVKNLKSIKKLADKEGISLNDLMKKIKTDE